jgi:hypothetical protein
MSVNKNNGPSENRFNNDVTYHKKWETKQNRHYRDMAMEIAKKSDCTSSIPLSWAREAYFFLRHLEHKYGIRYSTHTHMGYYFPRPKEMLKYLFVTPITTIPRTLKKLFKDVFAEPSRFQKQTPTRKDRIKETLFGFCGRGGYFYGYQILWHRVYGFLYNKIKKPKIALSQFKEKFGYVTVYFHSDDEEVTKDVNKYIKRLQLSLSRKGAYYDMSKK